MKTRGILDDDHGMKEVFGEGNDRFERKISFVSSVMK